MSIFPFSKTTEAARKEKKFLDGPHSRWRELVFLTGVVKGFIAGFRKFHFIGPCVTVFGSARFAETHHYYGLARDMGKSIAGLGFTVITGGGPGIMEAANRGAREAGGHSVGCNIVLPHEQKHNPYLDLWVDIDYFFVRKVLLTKYSLAFVVMPGGYGTLDEFFEAITLIQTGKLYTFPVVLMGCAFHKELQEHIQKMIAEGTIGQADAQLYLFTDSVEEAIQHIRKHTIERFDLRMERPMTPWRILGEKGHKRLEKLFLHTS
jgi:uncharacterized protein (TIGR00730 family)